MRERAREAQQGSPARATRAHAHLEDEIGDLLFAVVNLCAQGGRAPVARARPGERESSRAGSRPSKRSRASAGIDVGEARLEALDALWDEVKARSE